MSTARCEIRMVIFVSTFIALLSRFSYFYRFTTNQTVYRNQKSSCFVFARPALYPLHHFHYRFVHLLSSSCSLSLTLFWFPLAFCVKSNIKYLELVWVNKTALYHQNRSKGLLSYARQSLY